MKRRSNRGKPGRDDGDHSRLTRLGTFAGAALAGFLAAWSIHLSVTVTEVNHTVVIGREISRSTYGGEICPLITGARA